MISSSRRHARRSCGSSGGSRCSTGWRMAVALLGLFETKPNAAVAKWAGGRGAAAGAGVVALARGLLLLCAACEALLNLKAGAGAAMVLVC